MIVPASEDGWEYQMGQFRRGMVFTFPSPLTGRWLPLPVSHHTVRNQVALLASPLETKLPMTQGMAKFPAWPPSVLS